MAKKTVESRIHKKWSEEEDLKLAEKWGKWTVYKLCRLLGRTEEAIKSRAHKLGLGRRTEGVDGVSIRMLCDVIYKDHNARYYRKLKEHGLPYFKMQTEKTTFYMVNIDKFWRWAKDHPKVVDVTRIEPLILGKEPGWVHELRQKKRYEDYLRRWGQVL